MLVVQCRREQKDSLRLLLSSRLCFQSRRIIPAFSHKELKFYKLINELLKSSVWPKKRHVATCSSLSVGDAGVWKKKEIEWCFVPAAYTFINIILADWLSCVIAADVVVVREVLAASQQLLLAAAVCWSSQQMSAQQVALLSTDSLLFPAGSLKKKRQSASSAMQKRDLMVNIMVSVLFIYSFFIIGNINTGQIFFIHCFKYYRWSWINSEKQKENRVVWYSIGSFSFYHLNNTNYCPRM